MLMVQLTTGGSTVAGAESALYDCLVALQGYKVYYTLTPDLPVNL